MGTRTLDFKVENYNGDNFNVKEDHFNSGTVLSRKEKRNAGRTSEILMAQPLGNSNPIYDLEIPMPRHM